jgi:hypothetical protein
MAMGDQGPTSIMDFVQRYRDYEESRNASHQLIRVGDYLGPLSGLVQLNLLHDCTTD